MTSILKTTFTPSSLEKKFKTVYNQPAMVLTSGFTTHRIIARLKTAFKFQQGVNKNLIIYKKLRW